MIKSSSKCTQKFPTSNGLRVGTPTGAVMVASHNALLDLKHLPVKLSPAARAATVHPSLSSKSLLSLGQLCDHGCDYVLLDKSFVSVIQNGVVSVIGKRDIRTGLWFVDIEDNPAATTLPTQHPTYSHQANSAYEQSSKKDLINFLHRAAFSPSVSTWTKAIDNNFFSTWPGLTADAVRKFLPKSLNTAKGHLKATRKNQRSTKVSPVTPPLMTTPSSPSQEPAVRTNFVYTKVVEVTGKIFTDQTGRFPVTSSKGNQYIMVLYDFDSNAILAEPMKNRSEREMVQVYTKLHTYLCRRGLKPRLQKLDNECPAGLKAFMADEDVTYQLVPPYDHRQNSAERAISTWKDHFIAGLASLDPNFPMHLWCRLIDQATLTLNLLRPARLNSRLSAEAYLNGAFDFNATPLAPPGTKVLIHETPNRRKTWAVHGVEGWYLGGAREHYRCYRVYASKTRAERVARTVEFFPHYGKMPALSSADAAIRAAIDLCWALRNPSPASPLAPVGDEQMQALAQLERIFSVSARQPTSTAAAPPRPPEHLAPAVVRVQLPAARAAPCPPLGAARAPVAPAIPASHLEAPPPPRVHLIDPDEDNAAPPRVARPASRVLASPGAQSPPNLILPDDDDDLLHRYPTRSRRVAGRRRPIPIPRPRPDSVAFHAAVAAAQEHSVLSVVHEQTGETLSYRHLVNGPDKIIWETSMANDLGRLAQGVGGRIKGTDTIFFVSKQQVPAGRKITYCKQEATIRPNKAEKFRVRNCAGGDKLVYEGPTATQCASLTTTKILLNSTISTKGARFTCADVKNFYYGTPMAVYEYMKMNLKNIPEEIINEYDLRSIADPDGFVYMEIRKGIPGLKQAGRIANDRLTTHLKKYGYAPLPRTPALWTHVTRPVAFTLVVDDFGIKYVGRQHAEHLLSALRDLYEVTEDPTGSKYCGLTIKWNYKRRWVEISMPEYIPALLHKFRHRPPKRRQDAPHDWPVHSYSQKVQYANAPDNSPVLSPSEITRVQQIVGTLLYYSISVDPTMAVALGSIASTQSKATALTQGECNWVLDYAASNPDATIRYHASNMVLYIHSDASYLSETKARSRAGGHFFLSSQPQNPNSPPQEIPPLNGPIHTLSQIIDVIVSSAAEAEIAGNYLTAQAAVPIRTALIELAHPQPPTPIQLDNTTAVGFANEGIKQKRSKAMDMRWYWIQDQVRQKQFLVYYRPGNTNLGDPFTKYHTPSHLRLMRPYYLQPSSHTAHLANVVIAHLVQGCVDTPREHVLDIPRERAVRAGGA